MITPIRNSIDYNYYTKQNLGLLQFLIVRHPFQRLVSAFRDKLERLHSKTLEDDYYYNELGKHIVGMYRTQAINKYGQEYFSEDNNYGAILPVSGDLVRKPELPIFWEFVQAIIDNPLTEQNEHWAPMYQVCSTCTIQFNTVIKFENLEQEETMLLKMLHLDHLVSGKKRKRMNSKSSTDLTDEEITRIYLSTLSEEELDRLYDIYHYDFVMFDYSYKQGRKSYPRK